MNRIVILLVTPLLGYFTALSGEAVNPSWYGMATYGWDGSIWW